MIKNQNIKNDKLLFDIMNKNKTEESNNNK